MNDWLANEPEIPETRSLAREDYVCPICHNKKKGLDDVCKKCLRNTKIYKEWLAGRQAVNAAKEPVEESEFGPAAMGL